MKKIISLVVFIVALAWTWHAIHSSQPVDFETHSGIQAKLAELIKVTLNTKKPNAKNLVIEKLWTESLGDNKVRAVFSYKFDDTSESGETVDQMIEGEAVLHREPTDDSKVDKWTLQSVKTTNDIVVFNEGSAVTSTGSDEKSAPKEDESKSSDETAPEHK